METQDVLNDSKQHDPERLKAWKECVEKLEPITETAAALDVVREYTKSLRMETQLEVEKVAAVYLRTFTVMAKAIREDTLGKNHAESLFMNESVMLDLNNAWYRQYKPILEPALAECKVSLMTALAIQNRPDAAKTDSDSEVIQSLIISSWDFIPWITFIANGNIEAYVACKELIRRMILKSKNTFGVE